MSKGTVRSVFTAVTFSISLMDTRAGLVVSQVIATLCVSCCPMKKRTLISIRARPCTLVVFNAIHIRVVIKGPVSSANRPPSSLVQEVPVETGEGTVLGALVLHEQWTLFCSKLLEICVVLGFLGLRVQHVSGGRRAACRGR